MKLLDLDLVLTIATIILIAQSTGVESASCSHGDVRLVNGPSALEGRVEVCNNGEWGTVCDDEWEIQDANVVCAQLGFGEAIGTPCNAYYGQGTGQIVLDDLGCVGNELSLFNCSHSGIGSSNCIHAEDASALCSGLTPCLDGDIRLFGGSSPIEGRVELCYGGEWGTVCDNNFDTTDALVICRQLGFNGTTATVRPCCSDYAFGEGTGSILLDEVGCTGSETSLLDCPHNGVGNQDCSHLQDVGIICSSSFSCQDGVRLVGGPSALEGRVEVCNNGEWGTVCDDDWEIQDANVVCAQLGFGEAFRAQQHFGQGAGPIVLDDLDCAGNESSLFDCPHVAGDAHNCVHCEDASVTCTFLDPCLSSPCDVNAQCVRDGLLTDTFTCTCNPEYTGDGFNCTGDHPISSFFPFGAAEGDTTVARNNNFHSDPINLVTGTFPMLQSAFSVLYRTFMIPSRISPPILQVPKGNPMGKCPSSIKFDLTLRPNDQQVSDVNNDGHISFNSPFTEYSPRTFPFSGDSPLIAPFWADIDTRPPDGGEIYYRETTDSMLLERAQNDVLAAFPLINFTPTLLFIATWNMVGFWPMRTDLTNTFQCILATDSNVSSVIFLYGDIQWISANSTGGVNGFGGNTALAGLNAGDGSISATVPGSQMAEIFNITSTSNVGKPGVWIFRIDSSDFIWPDPCLTVTCDSNATCSREGEFSGEFNCTCNANFSGDGFTCFVDCGGLADPDNGVVQLSATIVDSLANYTCSVGHNLVGNDTRTCQSDTMWSGTAPICQAVDCGALLHPTNGSVALSETVFQSLANYSCDSGYLLTGNDTRVCQEDGQWSGAEPVCIATCANLTDPENGEVSLTGTLDGSLATYTCSIGHNLVGNDTRTCQSDTMWSGTAPICQAVDCGALHHPTNGSIALSETVFQSLANYSCDSGYLLTGNDTRVCQEDGQWSGAEPVCIADCGNLTDPVNGRVHVNSTLEGASVQYTCNEGFILSLGDTTRVCMATTRWSGLQPVCAFPDPCLEMTCDTNAVCERQGLLSNLFNCSCSPPFEGSGFNCTIPDPCLSEPCDVNAMCTRDGLLNSNFTCACDPGYTGDGFSCIVPDPCLSDPCDANATCTRENVLNSNFSCDCLPSFEGDGFNCTVAIVEVSILEQYRDVIISVPSAFVGLIALVVLLGVLYGYVRVVKNFVRNKKPSLDSGTDRNKLL